MNTGKQALCPSGRQRLYVLMNTPTDLASTHTETKANMVKPTEVISYTRASGTTISGVVEDVNLDPALGTVSFTFLAQTEYGSPPVLTLPLDALVYIHA